MAHSRDSPVSKLFLTVMTLGLISGGAGAAETAVQRTVNVYGWADYIAPQTLTRFEQQTGIRINYDTFDSADMLEAKLLTGGSGYDVVIPGVAMLDRLIRADALQPSQMQHYPPRWTQETGTLCPTHGARPAWRLFAKPLKSGSPIPR